MIGIFDSGAGGLAALYELRSLMPSADIIFLKDKEHAPYGTRSADEITSLAECNVKRLCELGASRVLIACCTASACYERMSEECRALSVPIIAPAARCAAENTENGTVAVIATDLTVKLGAFSRAFSQIDKTITVREIAAQPLVAIAERIADGAPVSGDDLNEIKGAFERVRLTGADTVILGCTHFSHLADKVSILGNRLRVVDAAKVGARSIVNNAHRGDGKTIYIG